jgi:restriction endonuclease S subunit
LFHSSLNKISASSSVLATTSSILAGCILPSSINFSKDFFAIYLLYKSKADIKTVSGVSSIISATHAALSKVVIFLPSFQISLPFMSSLGI